MIGNTVISFFTQYCVKERAYIKFSYVEGQKSRASCIANVGVQFSLIINFCIFFVVRQNL